MTSTGCAGSFTRLVLDGDTPGGNVLRTGCLRRCVGLLIALPSRAWRRDTPFVLVQSSGSSSSLFRQHFQVCTTSLLHRARFLNLALFVSIRSIVSLLFSFHFSFSRLDRPFQTPGFYRGNFPPSGLSFFVNPASPQPVRSPSLVGRGLLFLFALGPFASSHASSYGLAATPASIYDL